MADRSPTVSCAKCGRSAESWEFWFDHVKNEHVLEASCHGEQQRYGVSHFTIARGSHVAPIAELVVFHESGDLGFRIELPSGGTSEGTLLFKEQTRREV
jgi:hypothetical protein